MRFSPSRQADLNATLRGRDARLDFWRGLCLVDMVLVHLVYGRVDFGTWLTPILGEYTRFAAGGFIFMAGLGVGAIFLPRAASDGESRCATYFSIWRRAGYILLVHFAATISFLAMDLVIGNRAGVVNPARTLIDVLMLREGDDLLPFYVIMIGFSPLLLEAMRRRYGWCAIAIASAALFLWGRIEPGAMSLPIQQRFPVPLWQTLFVTGLFAGATLPRYDALRRRWKIALASAATLAFAILFVDQYAEDFGWPWPQWAMLTFSKVPLSCAEILRYLSITLSIVLWTDLAWQDIADARWVHAIATMGRRSLAVYVAHVWVVGICVAISWQLGWLGAAQGLLAIGAIAALLAVARGLDRFDALDRDRLGALLANRWSLTAGTGIVCAAMLLALNLEFPKISLPDPMSAVLPPLLRAASPTLEANQSEFPDPGDDVPDDDTAPPQDSSDMVQV